jgi:hypothetical protein
MIFTQLNKLLAINYLRERLKKKNLRLNKAKQ